MVRRTRLNKGGRVTASCVQKTPGGTPGRGQPCDHSREGYRLVRAMKRADAEMHDADANGADVVGWARDFGRKLVDRVKRQAHHGPGSCLRTPSSSNSTKSTVGTIGAMSDRVIGVNRATWRL